MRKMMFWTGLIVLAVGTAFSVYSYSTIRSIIGDAGSSSVEFYLYQHPELEQQWDLANLLLAIGFGMLVLGAIILGFQSAAKKGSRKPFTPKRTKKN